MLRVARRGRPSLTTDRGDDVFTASRGRGLVPPGAGVGTAPVDALGAAGGVWLVDRVRDSLHEISNAAATRSVALVGRTRVVISPPYGGYGGSQTSANAEVPDACQA